MLYQFAPPLLTSFAVHGKNIVSESLFSKILTQRNVALQKSKYLAFISTISFFSKSSLDQFATCCRARNWKKYINLFFIILLYIEIFVTSFFFLKRKKNDEKVGLWRMKVTRTGTNRTESNLVYDWCCALFPFGRIFGSFSFFLLPFKNSHKSRFSPNNYKPISTDLEISDPRASNK